MKVVTITGYKPFELNIFKASDPRIKIIKETLKRRLIPLIEDGLQWVLVSGQMGVELWTCQVIMDLQDTYDIKLGVIPPFENQESRWPEPYQLEYEEVCIHADFFQPLYQSEYKGPFQFKARDKWLIAKSDGCLVLTDEEYPGSTAYFLEEAKQAEKFYMISHITPFDLDETVQDLQAENINIWDND
ncbi:SLOG family protein [Radiobacillus kanasensis]|uniref:SLOG family protein n=1 Tax=Radiobacillus kanasensis TaxID=2844358 RepID=UPI001E394233|nr:SLOG family protein [Radiobacillus kanasensis]UFU01265.1 SLOG family protein [Radiobacillus kanasensis]